MKNNSTYKPIIGMEIHTELKTKSKIFCGCPNDPFGAPAPNTNTCPVCLGMPGGLPVANKTAIEWTIKLGLALHCQINLFSKFDRKHYFYPDLPKGYQISQYDLPFCYDGYIETSEGRVGIRRIHLEEDTAKLQHKTIDGEKVSLVDFNRSSVPLVEIVTEPDIKSGAQAKEYAQKIRQILRYLDIANCDMEQGGMRLEANLSLKPVTDTSNTLPPYKVELKNINSFRFLEQAVDYEIDRQSEILDQGEFPVQETRGWNSQKNISFSQRTKESAEDYRYFPDPDLPPFNFSPEFVEELRATLPELPEQKQARWTAEFGLESKLAEALSSNRQKASWYETVLKEANQQKLDLNQLTKDIINKKIAVQYTEVPSEIIEKYNALHETTSVDQDELTTVITQILESNADAVSRYKAGQKQVFGFFMGQVMQRLGKKVDPNLIRSSLEQQLNA